MEKLLKDLLMSDGISGYEENVASLMTSALSRVCYDVKTDTFGNVIGKLGKGKKKIMIAAHMDEIGMIVKYVNEKGFIYFSKIGGINDSILPGEIIKIINKKGEYVTGVIGTKPPHLISLEESKQSLKHGTMFIDIGINSRDEVLKVINIGDQITFESKAGVLNGDFYYGKAADNRIGCYAMVKVMEALLKLKNLNARIYACATVQEEVGLKGGKIAAFKINPDFALVIDTAVAGDMPGIKEEVSTLKLGNGVAITMVEASGKGTVVPQKVRNIIFEAINESNIPHQVDIFEGGMTDGAVIYTNREGVPTGVLNIPTRYIHAPTSVFNIKDLNHTIDLAVKVIEK
ncbi:MAG: M42 family metallopeptidase, partial [Endomicrobium sp.]|nr:M42 family metallopeptidase [Endomicrobium sp.]